MAATGWHRGARASGDRSHEPRPCVAPATDWSLPIRRLPSRLELEDAPISRVCRRPRPSDSHATKWWRRSLTARSADSLSPWRAGRAESRPAEFRGRAKSALPTRPTSRRWSTQRLLRGDGHHGPQVLERGATQAVQDVPATGTGTVRSTVGGRRAQAPITAGWLRYVPYGNGTQTDIVGGSKSHSTKGQRYPSQGPGAAASRTSDAAR